MFMTVLSNVLNPVCLLSILGGVAMGISFGAMPGLTSTMGVALLMPITFSMDPHIGMLLLIGIFCGAIYGGSITAILINTPGTPSAAATVLDGYKFTERGEAGRALGISTVASFGGGIISGVILILVAPQLAQIALKFNAPESFALAFFGLSIIASISGKDMVKGLMSGTLGLLLSLIGMDNVTAYTRFSFGSTYLMGGLSFIPVLVGLFALSQCFLTVEEIYVERTKAARTRNPLPTLKDLKTIAPTILRAGLTGTFIGIIPGAGGDISAFVSYDMERRLSKHPEKFGTGIPEGIAAPEASNNGTTGGALIPLLTLGIPGDANTAVMLGALMMHNLTPGPQLFLTKAETVNTLFAGFIIANVCMLILGFLGQPLFVKIVSIPKRVLVPVIIVMCTVGSFAINNNYYDIIIMLIAGIVGYFMSKGGYPLSPIVLALILGPMAEGNFRRSLVMSQGSYSIFFQRPFSAAFIIIGILSLLWPIISHMRGKWRMAQKG
ncbi:tripartite tricarboxylate transporter permease [Enterocloster citroniae]|uniref:tripartite tricarboxylate transporter permease n=1 Tax=Enterocloster citroniae TaxID=358743 RepID=UPI001D07B1F0|nr:tripartite tricarboxylate transporter permease [Enterocloster citroniae]MCB7066137.1 tripartite tricarboxylate transporter permease [Enterocloster citroniae]MCD8277619.1 tripartite tricarboxylate transporter permease [Enterocloster citroniae]